MELRPKGKRHSILRDKRAVTHHYNLSNEYFSLFLDESMTYSCAIWSRGATTLEEAQEAKHELICQKLGLERGQRVLDVGSGWGAFAIHAAKRHGVRVTGITVSPPQVERARWLAEEAGVGDLVDFRLSDYRDLAGETYDAVASVGMVEHVGAEQMDEYGRRLRGALRPGGTLLLHGIANLQQEDPRPGPFSARYVFPDGAPQPLSRMLLGLERAGFETHHVEGFREDYAETLRWWARALDDNLDEATRLAGAERVRVWRLYLRAARNGFETGFTSVYQIRAS
jgi:cyclopropane-fatty-acyl-phospholipid synthase